MLRVTVLLAVSGAVAALAAGCGGSSTTADTTSRTTAAAPSKGKSVTIRIGSIYTEDTTYGKALDKFKQDVEKKSGGRINVKIFEGGSLGSEQDEIEAVKEGSLEMMETGTAGIGLYVPVTALFELWYTNHSLGQLVHAFQNVAPKLRPLYQKQGFQLLGAYYDGPRDILSKKPLPTLDAVQGLKLRVPDADLYVKMANALGAQAVSLPYTDVYTSLQTGGIDAMEGTPDSIYQEKFYEQAKYLDEDKHTYQPLSIVYNKAAWNKLSQSDRDLIQKAVNASSEYQRSLVDGANRKAIANLKKKGIEIVQVKDRDQWAAKTAPARKKFAAQFGKTGKLIIDAMANASQ